jgi:hypothetical protein
MEELINSFFAELNETEGLINYPTLLILNKANENDITNFKGSVSENSFFVIATSIIADGSLKINKDTYFDSFFSLKNPNNIVSSTIQLKYININPKYEIDYLPGGYFGFCQLDFINEIPNELFNSLALNGSKRNPEINNVLVLTQKELINK